MFDAIQNSLYRAFSKGRAGENENIEVKSDLPLRRLWNFPRLTHEFSSLSIAQSKDSMPSSLPTTHRIPIRLASSSSSSVLYKVNITIGTDGIARSIPSAAVIPSEVCSL